MDPIELQAIIGLIAMLALACVGAAIIGLRERKRAERRRYCLPPRRNVYGYPGRKPF